MFTAITVTAAFTITAVCSSSTTGTISTIDPYKTINLVLDLLVISLNSAKSTIIQRNIITVIILSLNSH